MALNDTEVGYGLDGLLVGQQGYDGAPDYQTFWDIDLASLPFSTSDTATFDGSIAFFAGDSGFCDIPDRGSPTPGFDDSSATLQQPPPSLTVAGSNEARPLPLPRQEMESNGAGALVAAPHPTSLPENPYTILPAEGMTMMDVYGDARRRRSDELATGIPSDQPYATTSQEWAAIQHSAAASPTSTNARIAASTLANINTLPFDGNDFAYDDALYDGTVDEDVGMVPETFAEGQQDQIEAYAKLTFGDGDYYITEYQVTLGRNIDYFRAWTKQQRQARAAEEVLQNYAQEPSQPSQPDGEAGAAHDPSSKSSQSLEGRPAKALPSNYSEQGGIASYPGPDETDAKRSRRSQRKVYASKSSSTTSVAPHALLASTKNYDNDNPHSENPDFHDLPNHAFVPVHPEDPNDIKAISKKHLLFGYDFEAGHWKLDILGPFAYYNGTKVDRGEQIVLQHLDRITVKSLNVTFKLPRGDEELARSPMPSHGAFADEEAVIHSPERTSPIRRLSNAVEAGESDDGADKTTSKKPKVKLNLNKKDADKTGKKQRKESADKSPDASKKPEKGKKPKVAAKEPAGPAKESAEPKQPKEPKEKKESPPLRPINLEGTGLENLPDAELPQRRKGPGRPPKNGLVSKRDLSIVHRKKRDFEKRGVVAPSFNDLIDQVREENRIKDAQAKAQAAGQPVPDMPPGVVQSIELDGSGPALKAEPVPTGYAGEVKVSNTPAEASRRMSPKPKRQAKSPSPIKPKEDCTEEELKKPQTTYVHQLDQILREFGKGDLQDIYDKMQKKWPYYKYSCETLGWQSSVRHNLLQNERFVEGGKSGKGKMWTINYDQPLEKEKRRRNSPQPRSTVSTTQNGQWPPGALTYGQQPPAYGSYGQPAVNGSQPPSQYGNAYASPYPNGSQPPPPGYAQPGQNMTYQQTAQQQQPYPAPPHPPQHGHPNSQNPNGHSQQQQPRPSTSRTPAPPTHFAGIVEEIMKFRANYLSNYPQNSDELTRQCDLFGRCTTYSSNKFHGQSTEGSEPRTEEERSVCRLLDLIFDRYEHLRTVAVGAAAEGAAVQGAQAVGGAASASGQVSGDGGAAAPAPAQHATSRITPTSTGHSTAPPQAAVNGANGIPAAPAQRVAVPTTVAAPTTGPFATPYRMDVKEANSTPAAPAETTAARVPPTAVESPATGYPAPPPQMAVQGPNGSPAAPARPAAPADRNPTTTADLAMGHAPAGPHIPATTSPLQASAAPQSIPAIAGQTTTMPPRPDGIAPQLNGTKRPLDEDAEGPDTEAKRMKL